MSTTARATRPRVVDDWWYVPVPLPDAPVRLVCLPHAGGDVTTFTGLAAALEPDVEVWALRLPGRGGRFAHPMPASFDDLVGLVAGSLRRHLAGPSRVRWACYGQSLGALLGYEVTRVLEPPCRPDLLVPASAPPPQLWPATVPAAGDHADQLLGQLSASLEDPGLRAIAMATLDADLRLCRSYRYRAGAPIRVPVHVLSGTADPVLDAGQLRGWAPHTTAGFRSTQVDAGHLLATVGQPGPVAVLRDVLSSLGSQRAHHDR